MILLQEGNEPHIEEHCTGESSKMFSNPLSPQKEGIKKSNVLET